jgi:hypothetical protein
MASQHGTRQESAYREDIEHQVEEVEAAEQRVATDDELGVSPARAALEHKEAPTVRRWWALLWVYG